MIYSLFLFQDYLLSKIVFISINYQTPMYAVWEKVSTKIVNRCSYITLRTRSL